MTALTSAEYFQLVLGRCRDRPAVRTGVVHPVKANVVEAVADAAREHLIEPVLIGPAARIRAAAQEAGVDIAAWKLVDTEHSHAAAAKAVALAAAGELGALMKGSLHSDELLGAVVRADSGLRTERRISHAFVMHIESYPKPFIITDAAVNIAPDLAAKADIVQNAINLWHVALNGAEELPKVAVLAAVETVNPHMMATLDAAALSKMAERGQITGAIVDGPLAFDNAISAAAAQEKGIVSPVAGHADILLVPGIEAGNMLAKQLTFLSGADAAGIVLGARVPIILTSRADNLRARLLSCALALLLADARRAGRIK
ncbi:bifunctional enoyl-CoA hydratase/phosphate acetyltransferase [Bosea minatitlanensis]|uniref:Bifunctional enoyl-CoA hydratase/phosphate acetyltransferase n=1 Tax=Bosea minatitlanensis TaxID=128782 RepID=A0ABW0F7Q8_9HYPH|nr:bifunctional enoyl-CoA hydratase/phosphate acetyltransferase [Bosea minatitlanensis]MCT4494286.1 bifunctional enoyl-CoA hydratase/phosphate acetyltransferase [Bosea minatitlanensis]